MEFLKNQIRFHFLYNGIPFTEHNYTVTQTETANTLTTVYTFCDGLRITNIAKKHGDAYEWVNMLENISDKPTPILSELWDTCVTLSLPHEEPIPRSAYKPGFSDITSVYTPRGSYWDDYDFATRADNFNMFDVGYSGHLSPGKEKRYSAACGLSSSFDCAPFFNVHKNGMGYIFAVGWSGQWNCHLSRTEDELTVKAKIEDTHFRLMPGESFRTSSFVLLPYICSVTDSQNQWRRLVKEHYSLLGQNGRDTEAPLCAGIWGGMRSCAVLDRLDTICKNNLPYEYVWIDAGWYGDTTPPTPDEFDCEWRFHTGDWRVSPCIHPNGLKDVADTVHASGRKFLLWFEPERAISGTPITMEHPEYFIFPEDENDNNLLLNLGNPSAWNYCFETLSHLIEKLGVDCYRQDFNTYTLPYWRKNDTEDRKGITEILHINGLYRLWDALLDRFPNLLIDNCAGGGRRIDIETLRRSVPLWRTDYQCSANFPAEGLQCHNLSFSSWIPYSGTGSGRIYDTYRIRSAYSPAMMTGYSFSEGDAFCQNEEQISWLKDRLTEYLEVRPYFSEDYYPLTECSNRNDIWCAMQFHRPSLGDGVLLVFSRENSPYRTAVFKLAGLEENAGYVFTDADGGSFSADASAIMQNGLSLTIEQQRTAKIYFYHKI